MKVLPLVALIVDVVNVELQVGVVPDTMRLEVDLGLVLVFFGDALSVLGLRLRLLPCFVQLTKCLVLEFLE